MSETKTVFAGDHSSISVLMSLYDGDQIGPFNLAISSIWGEQSLKPSQIVLVLDGALRQELYDAVLLWQREIGLILKVVQLDNNIGLGWALKEGLLHCDYEYIARMDSDDMSLGDRFVKQARYLEQHSDVDVVGGYISEIDENGFITRDSVKYPLGHSDMHNFFNKRDPLPHVTAMFRKSFFEKAGSYSGELRMAEDTLLWFKGFNAGCVFANIPYVVVQVRQTDQFYKRRGDISKSISLLKFRLFVLNRSLKYGLLSDVYALAYFLMSISPSLLKRLAYRIFR
jgi:glycosyltransferase involved in cell wall biosynthesis